MVVLQSVRQSAPALDKKNVIASSGLTYHSGSASSNMRPLISRFVDSYKELKGYQQGVPVVVDGETLSLAAITAASRYGAQVTLSDSAHIKDRVAASRSVMENKVSTSTSVYGVSTGFGGSADTRTDQPLVLGNALLQHQQSGVLPSEVKVHDVLPLLDPMGSAMPESWVRGAMLIRMNSLIRGHSAVRWELIEKINELMSANITPMVPLRGSISASGDLSPLSYIAGTLIGNPSIRVFDGPSVTGHRQIVPSTKALADHGIKPISLVEKEPLGILNGTAFSASVASLALHESVHMALMAQVLTAMGTEALAGTRGSYDKFIHAVARPHPGQVEAAETIFDLLEGSTFASTHEEEVTLDQDKGLLRQDRYPLRTSPQFLGPQIEDILYALETVTRESNSTTDNPLVDGTTGEVHHGGNFQAMAVSNAMEKTRLALHHIGKLLFAQCTELVNPTMNRGLPPSLAATDPSLNYHTKGVDIATAAYVSELGYLANPVSTHIQSAEMHNQAVNSLALISARATVASLEVLSILMSSYLYVICQALDLRALQTEFIEGLETIIAEELSAAFGSSVVRSDLASRVSCVMNATFEQTSTMDGYERMDKVASSSSNILIDYLAINDPSLMAEIPTFRARVAEKAAQLLDRLRYDYLSGARGPAPASRYLNKTRPIYEHVRLTLGIRMHGNENYTRFANGPGTEEQSIGQNISLIHESIRDGKMQDVVVGLFA